MSWPSRSRYLVLSLTTRVQSLGPTEWKERPGSYVLWPHIYTYAHARACTDTYTHKPYTHLSGVMPWSWFPDKDLALRCADPCHFPKFRKLNCIFCSCRNLASTLSCKNFRKKKIIWLTLRTNIGFLYKRQWLQYIRVTSWLSRYRGLLSKLETWILSLGPTIVKGEKWIPHVVLWSPHVHPFPNKTNN